MYNPLSFNGYALITARLAAKHSVRSLSIKSGLSRATIARLEANRADSASVNFSTVNALSKALNVDARSLLDV